MIQVSGVAIRTTDYTDNMFFFTKVESQKKITLSQKGYFYDKVIFLFNDPLEQSSSVIYSSQTSNSVYL